MAEPIPPWLKAMTSPLNLGVLGTGAVLAFATGLLPILAVGIAAWGALVAWEATASPVKILPEPPEFPSIDSLEDNFNKELIENLKLARQELEKVLSQTPRSVCNSILGALIKIRQLEQHAVALVARGEDIGKYLKTKNIDRIRAEAERLGRAASGARDPTAKTEYQQAVKARSEQLAALSELEDARERLRANLSRILATLEGLSPKVVRMRTLDAQSLDAAGGDVSRELEGIDKEVQEFESTLRSLAEGGIGEKEAMLDAELAGIGSKLQSSKLQAQKGQPL
jgi:hypothetical protein